MGERRLSLGQAWIGLGLAGVVALVVLPLAGLVVAAVNPAPDPFTGQAPGLAALVQSAHVGGLLGTTLALGALVTAGAVGLGTLLAWAEARWQTPGRRWLAIGTLLPLAMPSYVVAATVATTLGPGGWIGRPLGLPRATGFWLAVVVLSVVTAPLVQLIVGAALARTSAAEEEAARTLGASPWRTFQVAVLPGLRTPIAFSGLLALLYAISDFGAVAVLDCPVLTWRLYDAVKSQDLARASVLGLATLGATLPLLLAARALAGDTADGGVANPRPPERRHPGRARALGLVAVQVSVIGLGVIVPLATLVGWVLGGVRRSLPFAPIGGPLLDTVGAALAGAALTLAIATGPAWAASRTRQGISRIEQAATLTSALPGVLVALGLLQAALALSRAAGGGALYKGLLTSGVLLGAGYAARFLAEVFAPLKTTMLQVDPRVLESARLLGAPPSRIVRQVIGPAVAPGVAVAGLIGFLAIAKELPVTLLLGGATGLSTLSFRIWDRYAESLWHDAGLAGLALCTMALAGVLVTLRWRKHV